jgi:hypothetical protein
MGSLYSMFVQKPLLPGHKEVSPARPKCTILEKAFQDLEKGVAECTTAITFFYVLLNFCKTMISHLF